MRTPRLRTIAADRRGTVSLEYALLALVIVSAVVLGSPGFSGAVTGTFGQMSAAAGGPTFAAKALD